MLDNHYLQGGTLTSAAVLPANYIDALKMRKQSLEISLAQVNKGIELLEKNPDIAEILDVLKKTLHY